ncbi:unnamed protein product [Rotaria magnacalcarata]|uniref:Uncharacterized protein n=1 Tax=Rotaria magnacalcarata TaxID=392030 RepID=A0A820BC88_9BILA|nr:unnamed protein product [Rotaria magnacalcarata]CAF2137090.1 unnamed protein product [Rotaria magnacalcarata]CAF4134727.1 unnamed protein product [Rotaria magnacalcarata]CAF4205095.1 unnamed protein product [Rotaria magnacalcarata]
MLRPPSAVRSSGLRPPTSGGLRPPMPSSHLQQPIRRIAPQPSPNQYQQAKTSHRQTSRPTMSSTRDPPVQSRPSIFPRNQAHTPMPSAARRTLIGVSRQSNVHKQHEQFGDENVAPVNYSIKQACDRLGYDYRHLMEEKRRIGYSGPGLIVPERTEVDEVLIKNIDVPFGVWLYKYVRLYPGEPLAENLNERQFVPERLDQNEVLNIVRPTNRNQRQTTRILDLFGDKSNTMAPQTDTTNEKIAKSKMPPPPPPPSNEFRFARSTTVLAINDEVHRSPRRLLHHSHNTNVHQQLPSSMLKRSQTQIINAKLDNESFDRDAQIRIRELKCSAIGQEFMEQLERLRSIDDPDLFTIKISMFDAALQRIEKIISMLHI